MANVCYKCNNLIFSKGLCIRHWKEEYGKPIKKTNHYIKKKVYKIPLHGKKELSKLIHILDGLLSKYIRLIYMNKLKLIPCFTCGEEFTFEKIQAGHFISRKHLITRFLLDNIKPQCIKCNCYLNGNLECYANNLGEEKTEELKKLSKQNYKLNILDLKEQISKYKILIKELENANRDNSNRE